MEVYIEIIYILNSLILLLSFEILFFLLNTQINYLKLIQYVLTYNISIVLLYIDCFNGFILFYYFILSFIYFRLSIYIYYPLFIFIYISLLSFLNRIITSSYIYQGILIIETLYSHITIIIGIFIFIIIYLYIYYCRNKLHNYITYVYIYNNKYKALIDTGNTVYYKGYPIIFTKRIILDKYNIIDTIIINSVTGKRKIDIILIENIKINNKVINNIYSGIIDEGEYDCILNTHLLGGML